VLIVDDNAAIRSFIRQTLGKSSEFSVCGEAENGQVGVDLAERLLPDVIILDLYMPIMNGIEAARILKQIMPSVPILMFTSFAEVAQGTSITVADRILSKSVSPDELVANLRSLCRRIA